ncbi:MAG: Grx4 family monothiol glutaredoxin [Pseudomonadota bacterium]
MDALDRIREQVENNPVVIYMKGSPNMPQCGFSARAAAALGQCGEEFAYINILMDPDIFQNLPQFANWPTFPQVYIDGELIGGCDITVELFEKGELRKMVKQAVSKAKEAQVEKQEDA